MIAAGGHIRATRSTRLSVRLVGTRKRHASVMIAALYVETDGPYYNVSDVDPWDIARDARKYAGPFPVVAHPPCQRYSTLAAVHHQRDGDDGGCFDHALRMVRTYGGVLEHPANSLAWDMYDLPKPMGAGWTRDLFDSGWTCRVNQGNYGHAIPKPTWLYYVGDALPEILKWGRAPNGLPTHEQWPGKTAARSRTPTAFRDALLSLARNAATGGRYEQTAG